MPTADEVVFCGRGWLDVTWPWGPDVVLREDLRYIFSTKRDLQKPKATTIPWFRTRSSFLGRDLHRTQLSMLWHDLGISPFAVSRRSSWMGSVFRHSAVPIGIQLINNLWRTRKSRLWDLRTFPFTMRSHAQVFGKFLLDISESAFLYN